MGGLKVLQNLSMLRVGWPLSMGIVTQGCEAGALSSVFKDSMLTWLNGDPVGAWWDRMLRVLFESE